MNGRAVHRPPRPGALHALALALAAAAAPARAAERYLAVLEFTGSGDRFVLEALAERVRSVASDALRGSYLVITRENVVTLLRQNEKTCDALDAACAVDLGRAVGADLVLSGRVRPVEDRLDLGLQLHETATGALVASEGASVGAPLEALQRVEPLSRSLLRKFVTPPDADGRPGGYLELRWGTAVLTSLPHEGAVGTAGDDSIAAHVIGGWRRDAHWARELSYAWLRSSDWKIDTAGTRIPGSGGFKSDSHTVYAGVEWTPFGVRNLALAAGAGPVFYDREVTSAAPPYAASNTGWGAGAGALAELRLSLGLKFLQLGVRGGARLLYAGKGLAAPDGSRRVKPGLQLDLPITVSVRFG